MGHIKNGARRQYPSRKRSRRLAQLRRLKFNANKLKKEERHKPKINETNPGIIADSAEKQCNNFIYPIEFVVCQDNSLMTKDEGIMQTSRNYSQVAQFFQNGRCLLNSLEMNCGDSNSFQIKVEPEEIIIKHEPEESLEEWSSFEIIEYYTNPPILN